MEVKNCAEIDSAKVEAESIKEENQSLKLSNDVLLERITLLEKTNLELISSQKMTARLEKMMLLRRL